MAEALRSGDVLGDTYRVLRLVGKGGMGEVYEAENVRLGANHVAIKVLVRVEGAAHESAFARFKREAEVTSRLQHPNIVRVFDYNLTPAGHPYFVMELLRGRDLASELHTHGAMAVPRAIGLIRQIALGLGAAHRSGVVHRDLKPQNILLVMDDDQELVKIVDFGISKVREATTELTQESSIVGTPQYMAPEQAQGRLGEIDERTDLFALGAIAYEMLAGREAFRGETSTAVLYQVVHEQPVPLTRLNPAVDPSLDAVVFKALAKRKQQRWASARELSQALDDAARGEGRPGLAVAALIAPTREADAPTTLGSSVGQVAARRGRRLWVGAALGAVVLGVAALALRGPFVADGRTVPAAAIPAPAPAPPPPPPSPAPVLPRAGVEIAPAVPPPEALAPPRPPPPARRPARKVRTPRAVAAPAPDEAAVPPPRRKDTLVDDRDL